MIDSDLCRYLYLDVIPFQYDIPLCMGLKGACMTKSILALLGWVRLRIGVASLGLANIKLWVADTVSCKGTPFILGSNQIKGIFNQVNSDNVNSWPQPWKSMYYRFFQSGSDSEDLYDSDDYDTEYEDEDSYKALCKFGSQSTSSTSNNSLNSDSDEEVGIPDLVSDENGNLTPAAHVECPLSSVNQEHPNNEGGEISVFTNLAGKSEGQAAEAGLPACNVKIPTPPNSPGWQVGPILFCCL